MATSRRAISTSMASGAMCIFGVLTRRRSSRCARPIAIPGLAPIPVSCWTPSATPLLLAELAGDELRQGRHGLLGVVAAGPHADDAPLGGDQHEDAHDALAVDGLAVLLHVDVGTVAVGHL